MNALKKLAGVLVFAAALAGAVAVSKYFSRARPAPAEPPPPAPALMPDDPRPMPYSSTSAPPVAVGFNPRLVLLDFAGRKSYVTLELERNPGPTPERLWAWVYFFSVEGALRTHCEAGPVEVKQPFRQGRRATAVLEAPTRGCSAPRTPSTTYYARVNVSADSAEAARLAPEQLGYDITKATPVVLQGAGR